LAALGFAIRNRWTRFAALTCGLVLFALLLETGVVPHYAAPITGLVYLLVIQSLRQLRLWRLNDRPAGRVFVRMLPACYLAVIAITIVNAAQMFDSHAWFRQRAAMVRELSRTGEKHLVIVRYSSEHNGHAEWVYNEADIDGSRIVWARDMGEDKNEELIEYFPSRRLWLLEADATTLRLIPYPHVKSLGQPLRG
jgi:hypothetical protein